MASSPDMSSTGSKQLRQDLRLPTTDTHYQQTASYVEEQPVPAYRHAPEEALEAFRDLKYGVRIHWGLYSIGARGNESWPFLELPNPEKQAYQELYRTWNPAGFDAGEWMDLFAHAGMRCVAFTTKHHDGFSLFDTRTRVRRRTRWDAPGGPRIEECDLAYSVMETPFRRDVVREICDAARSRGLAIDLYFSHPDWYDADFRPYGFHPLQTPDACEHPASYGGVFGGRPYTMGPDITEDEQRRMVARHREQLKELLTNYGPVDMVCLDMWMGELVWPQMRETMLELRDLQPRVLFRARGIGNYGDFFTPEGFVPGAKENTAMPWMVIHHLGSSFSNREGDTYKDTGWIIHSLVDAVAKGGSFMLGIGPDGEGRFEEEVVRKLEEAGEWLRTNGEAIYATRARAGDLWQEGDAIRFTRSKDGRTVYACALSWPGERLRLASVRPRAGSAIRLLGSKAPLAWQIVEGAGLSVTLPPELQLDAGRPCRYAWCFAIETAEPEGV